MTLSNTVLPQFDRVWCADFEFDAPDGERPRPRCMVARELRTDTVIRLWEDDLKRLKTAPFETGPTSLMVAYYASAEIGCFLSLGWRPPDAVLDLFTEFRNLTNGMKTPCGNGLLGAMAYFGLDTMAAVEKQGMRDLARRGGQYAPEEVKALLDYCRSDTDALGSLLVHMVNNVNINHALLRGRFMRSAAFMEHHGIPIDVRALNQLQNQWDGIRASVIREVDQQYSVFDGLSFRADRWSSWAAEHNIAWPRLDSGALSLKKDTFKAMAASHPEVAPMHELRATLSALRSFALPVGSDGRNRVLLSAFGTVTGRCAPSTTRFIFGLPSWLRSLIKPEPGSVLIYADYSQQEFGIAAALSGDENMMRAYHSGDPYIEMGKLAGLLPDDATKKSHPRERQRFKQVVLGVQYGMGAQGLAAKIGCSQLEARELLSTHQRVFKRFWAWSDSAVDHAFYHGHLRTVYGWNARVADDTNPRRLRNFPMQANGAEMLRLASCLCIDQGVKLLAPVHDAILVEAEAGNEDEALHAVRNIMERASAHVLGGFTLSTDSYIIAHPDRYRDERGAHMWELISRLLSQEQKPADEVQPEGHRCTRIGWCAS